MTADELMALTKGFDSRTGCQRCAALECKGWESLPGDFDRSSLQRVGTLRDADSDEPTFAEYHPAGTHGWSHNAPIALGWFPYNRCELWQCAGCGRPFLRYTEFGGYYADERIRELQAGLIQQPSLE